MYDIEKIREVLNEEQKVKQCAKCKREFPATTDYYYKHKAHKDGLHSYCKECCAENVKKYRQTKKGKTTIRRYYEKNKEKFKQYNANRYKNHAKEMYQYQKEYKKSHPEKFKRFRKSLFKEALFNYVFSRYFEYKEGAIIRYDFFYNFLLGIAKKFHLNYSRYYITLLLKRDKNLTLPFLKKKKRSVRSNQKTIHGLKLKNKEGKIIEVSNLCNLEIEKDTITSKKACVLISCLPGQKKLEEIYNSMDPSLKSHINYPKAVDYYKKIETILYRKNVYRSANVKIATVFYLASDLSQEACSEVCGGNAVTLRSLLVKVLKLPRSQIDKIRNANRKAKSKKGVKD